jgi:hypothetical protein
MSQVSPFFLLLINAVTTIANANQILFPLNDGSYACIYALEKSPRPTASEDEEEMAFLGTSNPIMVKNFVIENNGRSLVTMKINPEQKTEVIRRTNTDKNHYVGRVQQLSESEIILDYYNVGTGHSLVQILKVEDDGSLTPVQEINPKSTDSQAVKIEARSVLNANTIVVDIRGATNDRDSKIIYHRTDNNKFKPIKKFRDIFTVEQFRLNPENSDELFFIQNTDDFDSKSSSKVVRLILSTGQSTVIVPSRKNPANTTPNRFEIRHLHLAGNIYGQVIFDNLSNNIISLRVLEPNESQKWVSIGDVTLDKFEEGYEKRSIKAITKNSFVILDDYSRVIGAVGDNLTYARLHRRYNLKIVTVNGSKISEQTLAVNEKIPLDGNNPSELSVSVLNPNELLLTGSNYVQVVRKRGAQFILDESVPFKGFGYSPIAGQPEVPPPGQDLEVIKVSDRMFIIQDKYVIRMHMPRYRPVNDKSQMHVFVLKNGKYTNVEQWLFPLRRVDSALVLQDERILIHF